MRGETIFWICLFIVVVSVLFWQIAGALATIY